MKKLQTEILSAVLIAGIVIGLVGVAYLWGKPLIEKRTTVAEYLKAKDFILELDKKITELSNTGSGEANLKIPTGSLRLIPWDANDPENNSLILELIVDQPMVMNESVPVATGTLGEVGIYGEAEPRVITLNVSSYQGKYLMRLVLHYRELDVESPKKGYKIVLDGEKVTGKERISLSFDKNEIKPGEAANGGDLVLTHIKVDLY